MPAVAARVTGRRGPGLLRAGMLPTIHVHSSRLLHSTGVVCGTQSERTQELLRKAAELFPGASNGNTIYQDTLISHGKGSRVFDSDGREDVDYVMGGGPMFLGHAHPKVVAAVQERMPYGQSFFATTECIIEHAAELCQHIPCAEQVRYCSSGTEATLFAIRAAKAKSGDTKPKILKFEGGYHGMNDYGLMSLTPDVLRPFPTPTPSSLSISKQIQSEVLIAPFNDLETTSRIIEAHKHELGAVICEAVQRVLEPDPHFLRGLRDICTTLEIPLIFDEIAACFRIAKGGAQEMYGVVPDLCSLGKVPAGGFPMGMVAGKAEFMEVFDTKKHMLPQVGTFNGHPIAAVAGLVHMREIDEVGFDSVNALGEKIKTGIREILTKHDVPNQVIGPPTLFDFFVTAEPVVDYRGEFHSNREMKARIVDRLKHHGVFKAGIKFYPSLVHDESDVKLTLEAFDASVKDVLEEMDGRVLD